jgi:hypothetical protein
MLRKRAAIVIASVVLLLLFGLLVLLPKDAPPTGDLAVTFLGVTNNPVASFRPIRLSMVQGTTGL